MRLTKTDYLLFREAPLHLWASKQSSIKAKPSSEYDQLLMQQGYEIQRLARKYLETKVSHVSLELISHYKKTQNIALPDENETCWTV